MSTSTRYSDLSVASSGTRDFVTRQRNPSIAQLIILFLSMLVVAIGVTLIATDKLAMIVILFVLFSALGWFVIVQTQRNRDLVLATEFQNALFSSALGMNNKFCLIAKPDGTIVYFDQGAHTLFPDLVKQTQRNLDALLEFGDVSRESRGRIWDSLGKNLPDKVMFDIRSGDGQINRIVLTVEPIQRPSGFVLLRGREFVEQRSNASAPVATAAATSTPDVKKKPW